MIVKITSNDLILLYEADMGVVLKYMTTNAGNEAALVETYRRGKDREVHCILTRHLEEVA